MAGKKFKLRVITPDKVLLDEEVQSLRFPGLDGGYGVLYNHAPLITALQPGELKAQKPDGQELHVFVSDGFVQVANNVVRLICDAGEKATDIDLARAKAAETRAREELRSRVHMTDIDELRAQAALLRSLQRQKIATKRLGR